MEESSIFDKYLERALHFCLLMLALSAPISIAATQTAWAFALLFWIIRTIFVRKKLRPIAFDLAVLSFVGLSLLSSFLSYEPKVSLGKMMGVSLITIVYLVALNVKTKKTLYRIIAVLLVSSMFTVAYTLSTRVIGKNLKVWRLTADSPLRKAGVEENDTIIKANNQNINSPDDLANVFTSVSEKGIVKLLIYRYENILTYELNVSALPQTNNNLEKFGIIEWSRGRDTRAAGFYGHYTTYAEALQLIAALTLGLLIVCNESFLSRKKILIALALGGFCLALLLTVTRASMASFMVSAGVMILVGASRKTLLICIALAIPLIVASVFVIQQKRNVAFVDTKDGSTQWRLIVWREGFDLLKSSPRHMLVGIGMDSIKTHWREWHLFDDGKIPIGHMHSTPLQLALERGVPTFLAWFVLLFLYLKMIWQSLKRDNLDWKERGLLLGAFGGTFGFFSSSLVHYNWGDSEVVMIFYLLMGLSLAVVRGLVETDSHKS